MRIHTNLEGFSIFSQERKKNYEKKDMLNI